MDNDRAEKSERVGSPIGVFDSGAGGLTVAKELKNILPRENIIYLGDTARVPYGSKSSDTVVSYARGCAKFLLNKNIKLLVVACNTASAHALETLQGETKVPVLGVIEPGVKKALSVSENGHIGVIGTRGTISSGVYGQKFRDVDSMVKVTELATPLLVPLVEEGWQEGEIAENITRHYLNILAGRDKEIDTLVLGCTHYPLLKTLLAGVCKDVFGHEVELVDSAEAVAEEVKQVMQDKNLLDLTNDKGIFPCYVTDESRIGELASSFLGNKNIDCEKVDINGFK